MEMTKGLTAQERAALVTLKLLNGDGKLSSKEVRSITGLSKSGAARLMDKISRVVPIYYEESGRVWILLCEFD